MYRSLLSPTKSTQPLQQVIKRYGHGHCHHTGKNALVDKGVMRRFKDPASYPLLGAITLAVTAASYTIYRNLRYNPDTHIGRFERHNELKDHLRDNADQYYHHGIRERVLQIAKGKEEKAKRLVEQ